MRILFRYKRELILLLLLLFIILIFKNSNRRPNHDETQSIDGRHHLAIIVPFRDRFDELLNFVPYMTKFLHQQGTKRFSIYVINQSSRYRFNRGALANVGYMLAKNRSDYIAIHDVDLVPMNANISYAYPEQGPFHVASPEYHPSYNYEKYFGGILLISNEHFEKVNGFSNRYFGWGLEDDEFYARVRAAKLPVFRPTNLTTTRNNTFLHFHHDRKRDTYKTKEQREILRYRDHVTGLKDLKFMITSQHNLTIDESFNCTVFNVELYCDIKLTPWCVPLQSRSKQRQALATTGEKTNDHHK